MKKLSILLLAILIPIPSSLLAQSHPVPTRLVVRAQAKDAKFIGTSMGGARVEVRKAATGELLAEGRTEGSTGDTGRLMRTPKTREMTLSTPGAARFETVIELERPTLVTVRATAPMGQPQSLASSSTQLWLIPGKDITGDGVLLEIPGFAVDILAPQAHESVLKQAIAVRANVVMMCGCPTTPGGLWDSDTYEIRALIYRDGEQVQGVPLAYAGKTSTFEGTFTPRETGTYEITVYAYHGATGNTGVDKTTVVVRE
ncbi:MAG: hypothetical protein R3224_06660 [Balneolaceae bacterium]|nr:hypothetical protein [Balneolaceae bacterium]